MREEVRRVGLGLMLERGFAATGVDDIVEAAGISRRSFYRYFGDREDLVLGSTDDQVAALVAALSGRPYGEPVWTALQRAAEQIPSASDPPEIALEVARLIAADPDLRARQLKKQAAWAAALLPLVVERSARTAKPLTRLEAGAIIGSAFACLDVATTAWVEDPEHGDLRSHYAAAVAAVRNT